VKKLFLCFAMVMACALAFASPPTAITEYFANAVVTTNSFNDAGNTGLSTGSVYVCLLVTDLTNNTHAAASITNDVRAFVSSVINAAGTSIAAKPSTNQFTTYVIDQDTTYTSATNRQTYYTITEQQTVTVTPSYINE